MKKEVFIAWHGSPRTFDRFDYSKLRDALGVFFTASRESAEYYARRGGRFLNGMVRQYRLSFRNVLRVHQGEEYAKWIARREGETYRDVRRRLVKAGYDGVRIEYDGGVVDYVAFSNRNISATMPVKRFSNLCALKSSSASLPIAANDGKKK